MAQNPTAKIHRKDQACHQKHGRGLLVQNKCIGQFKIEIHGEDLCKREVYHCVCKVSEFKDEKVRICRWKERTVLCCKSLNNDETINPYICSNDNELSLDLIGDNELKETSVLQPRIEFEQSVNRKK